MITVCLLLVIFGIGVALGIGSGPPLFVFLALWAIVIVWYVYWSLLRVAYDLELDGPIIRWRAPLRSGTVNLSELAELRPSNVALNVETFRLATGASLMVLIRRNFQPFADILEATRPELPVRLRLNICPGPRWASRKQLGK
jgi:hypothetical protein